MKVVCNVYIQSTDLRSFQLKTRSQLCTYISTISHASNSIQGTRRADAIWSNGHRRCPCQNMQEEGTDATTVPPSQNLGLVLYLLTLKQDDGQSCLGLDLNSESRAPEQSLQCLLHLLLYRLIQSNCHLLGITRSAWLHLWPHTSQSNDQKKCKTNQICST